jgi:2-phospho-L-lactate guanylyltransferase
VLIIPADLPLITPDDVRAMLARAKEPPVVVIAPDRRQNGTNALLVCPAGLIEYEFGPGSFKRHCARAQAVGARLEVCELSSLALDMDLPEDLAMVSETLERYLSDLDSQAAYPELFEEREIVKIESNQAIEP